MSIELEIKLVVESHDSVRRAVRDAGGTFISTVVETNHILDRRDGDLQRSGAALRVRSCRLIDGKVQPATLTYKGPLLPSNLKAREEIEVSVDDADKTLKILESIGCCQWLAFQKRRETWRLDDGLVLLDELPALGRFVEIEGPDESSIARVQRLIGLADREHVTSTYVKKVINHCREQNIDPPQLMFDA